MKRNVFLAALFMVLVALNGSHGQPRINHSTPDRFAEKKEALVKIVRAWQEARGSESRLKEYHQLYMERIRGVQSDSEDFMKVCKELILLERSIRRRDSMKEVKDKIIRKPLTKTPSPTTNGISNPSSQKELSKPLPTEFNLSQNFPNPFNPTTSIQYALQGGDGRPETGNRMEPLHTTLKIYNILGQEVRTLVNEIQEPGYYTVTWDGRDDSGQHVASGVYFYRLTMGKTSFDKSGGDYTEIKRMILLK